MRNVAIGLFLVGGASVFDFERDRSRRSLCLLIALSADQLNWIEGDPGGCACAGFAEDQIQADAAGSSFAALEKASQKPDHRRYCMACRPVRDQRDEAGRLHFVGEPRRSLRSEIEQQQPTVTVIQATAERWKQIERCPAWSVPETKSHPRFQEWRTIGGGSPGIHMRNAKRV
jgi:hypothetical protein